MKKHLLALIGPDNLRKTILYFVASAVLIIASQVVGITDNLPGIAMLMGGMICLFYTIVHPWRKSKNFATFAWVSVGLILLTILVIGMLSLLHKTEYISEGVVMGIVFLIGLPGMIVGTIGYIFWSSRKK